MREKFIDEQVGMYFIWGQNAANTHSYVNDGRTDVFEALPNSIAEQVVQAQDEFREKLYALLEPLKWDSDEKVWK